MNTEITDKEKVNGWVLYDAECPFCVRIADRLRNAFARRQLVLLPLQTPWIRNTLGLCETELLSEMRLLKREGDLFGGADAWLEISRSFWWTWPLRALAHIPVLMRLARRGYRWIADHRHCVGGACQIGMVATTPPSPKTHHVPTATGRRSHLLYRLFDFLPLLILPLLALMLRDIVAPWVFMWLMAFAIFYGCKWLTYRVAIYSGVRPGFWLRAGYLFAWPGMDAKEFLNVERIEKAPEDWRSPKAGAKCYTPRERDSVLDCGSPLPLFNRTNRPTLCEWRFAAAKTLFGAMLLWGGARLALPQSPLLAGWLGMIGVIFLIHFGVFHLLQLAWQAAGINATPVMNNPLKATSLLDFWGARWNTAFNELAFRFAFRPLRRWTRPAAATLMVFLLSGLIHDLLISLPARGGYGLPTLYFLAQGAGIQIERSRLGRHLGLAHGARGWLFTLLVTAGPAFWLFHPPFIHYVILPMLTAIGAI